MYVAIALLVAAPIAALAIWLRRDARDNPTPVTRWMPDPVDVPAQRMRRTAGEQVVTDVAAAASTGSPAEDVLQVLDAVPGLGPVRRDRVASAFPTLDALRAAAATLEELLSVQGVGPAIARRIAEAVA